VLVVMVMDSKAREAAEERVCAELLGARELVFPQRSARRQSIRSSMLSVTK
jgi:hypothetical protein